jgi:ABC-type phosphate/phosphonate transport system substrate-binding protein
MIAATMPFIAALPMYDWPERRCEVDAEWAAIRDRMRARGIAAPEHLARCNADLPALPGGIRDMRGEPIAPDPANLPPGELDLPTLWRHPALLFGQTCWGPMEVGLQPHVTIVAEPDYSDVEGGAGPFFSSAIVMRRADLATGADERAPDDGRAAIPLDYLRGGRFAYNGVESMSGYLAPKRDLERAGPGLSVFAGLLETGSHRGSVRAVAGGAADVAAIDARSWHLARRYEPAAQQLVAAGWTMRRKGLPFIAAAKLAHHLLRSRAI